MIDFIESIGAYIFGYILSYPLNSTLVKYRAHYAPKRIELVEEGDGVRVGSEVSSYFAMLGRVWRLEGWIGLYKGFVPNVLLHIISTIVGVVLPSTIKLLPHMFPLAMIWARLVVNLVMMFIFLLARVTMVRAITTPYKLPWFDAKTSLHVLLTSSERKSPSLMILTPGLLVCEILSVLYSSLVYDGLRHVIFPVFIGYGGYHILGLAARLAAYLALALVTSIVMCPLSVIFIRLSCQRNHPDGDSIDVPLSSPGEEVVRLRDENDPYHGFIDCVKRIANEEGYWALYLFRAWWLDFIFLWWRLGFVF